MTARPSLRSLVREAARQGSVDFVRIARIWRPRTCPNRRKDCPDGEECAIGIMMLMFRMLRHYVSRRGSGKLGFRYIDVNYAAMPATKDAIDFFVAWRAQLGLETNREWAEGIVVETIRLNDDTSLSDQERSAAAWHALRRIFPKGGLRNVRYHERGIGRSRRKAVTLRLAEAFVARAPLGSIALSLPRRPCERVEVCLPC